MVHSKIIKSDKKRLLKQAQQLIAMCSEYTPPEVTYSEYNMKVGRAMAAVDSVIKALNQ